MKKHFFFILLTVSILCPSIAFGSNNSHHHCNSDTHSHHVHKENDGMIHFFVGPLKKTQWVFFRSAGYGFLKSFSFVTHPFNVLLAASVAYDIKKHNSSFLIANCAGFYTGKVIANAIKSLITASFLAKL
jgi:hypothetical protein